MNIEQMKLDPTKEFDKPFDIVKDERLSNAQKLELLQQWEADAQLMQEAATEGMTGGEDALLREVSEARKAVESL